MKEKELFKNMKSYNNNDCDSDNEEYFESGIIKGQKQKQCNINKQLIKQKISEEYTNDMLGRALSKAENFAINN